MAGDRKMVRFQRLFSRQCCGGPVVAMTGFCLGFGLLFLLLSADALGLVFIAVGGLSMLLCLYLGNLLCVGRRDHPRLSG